MRAYKIEVLVLDGENMSEEEVKYLIRDNKYLEVQIKDFQSRPLDWSDNHPLNIKETADDAYRKLFNAPTPRG